MEINELVFMQTIQEEQSIASKLASQKKLSHSGFNSYKDKMGKKYFWDGKDFRPVKDDKEPPPKRPRKKAEEEKDSDSSAPMDDAPKVKKIAKKPIKKASKSELPEIDDSTGFFQTEAGKIVLAGLYNLVKHGKVTSKQKRKLENHIFSEQNEDGFDLQVRDSEGKTVTNLEGEYKDALEELIRPTENKAKAFSKFFEEAALSQEGNGENLDTIAAAKKATIKLLSKYAKNPSKLPENWKEKLEEAGINPEEPYEISEPEHEVKGESFETGKKVSMTPRQNVNITQGDTTIRAAIRFTRAPASTISVWKVENLENYFTEVFVLKEDDKKSFETALEALQSMKDAGSDSEPDIEDELIVGDFMRSESGRKFLIDISTDTTQIGKLPEDSSVTHIMIVGSDGDIEVHTPEEYIDGLRSVGVGIGGSGISLKWMTPKVSKEPLLLIKEAK